MSEHHAGPNRLSLTSSRAHSTDASDDVAERTSDESAERASDERDDPTLPTVLASLDDEHCRTILALLDGPKSASQLCAACDLSSSTVYRKLELLRESALVREYTEVRGDGPNVTRYERDFTDVSIGIDDAGEFSLRVTRPEPDAEDRLATFWSAMKEES